MDDQPISNFDNQPFSYPPSTSWEKEQSKLFRLRRRNLTLVISFILITGGITALFINPFDSKHQNVPYLEVVIISLAGILLGVGLILYIYLQAGTIDRLLNPEALVYNETEISPIPASYPTSDNVASFQTNFIEENTSQSNSDKYNPLGAVLERKISIIQSDYRKVIQRIVDEIGRLTKTANVNLIFGSLTTVAGITVLIFNAFEPLNTIDIQHILAHYIPKLSITIFVEIFAFFFLKIYKTTLSDIKYFHNERTNIEQKVLSLKAALLTEDKTVIEFVVKELAKTERNYILKRGETTIELEKDKAEISSSKNILTFLKPLLKFNDTK